MYFKKINSINNKVNKQFKFNWIEIIHNSPINIGMFKNTKLLGLISLTPEEKYIHINDLEVISKYQHHHLGSTLVALASWYSFHCDDDDGCMNLKSKTDTENFYKKLGAQVYFQLCIFNNVVSKKLVDKYQPEGGFEIHG